MFFMVFFAVYGCFGFVMVVTVVVSLFVRGLEGGEHVREEEDEEGEHCLEDLYLEDNDKEEEDGLLEFFLVWVEVESL